MAGKVQITGGVGHSAAVNHAGELLVSIGDYDITQYVELAVDATVYNVFEPRPGYYFIITGIVAFADRQVAAGTNATITIYSGNTASSGSTDSGSSIILKFELGANMLLTLVPLRIKVSSGKYINATTDDDDVHLNIIGHYLQTPGQNHPI